MRLNVEEHAFGDSRLKKLAFLSQIEESFLIGPLPRLWHGSQSEGKVEATKEEILDWCLVFEEKSGNRLFDGLLDSGYISKTKDNYYRIHGNEAQILSMKKHLERSRKGGASTKRKLMLMKLQASRNSSANKAQADSGFALSKSNTNQNKEKISKKKSSSESEQSSSFLSDADASDVSLFLKSKIPKKWEGKISDFDMTQANEWLTYAKEQAPRGRFDQAKFVVAICKMRHEYQLSEDDITSLFSWCQNSEFWRDKSFSPVGLVRRKGERTSLDLILYQKSQEVGSLNALNANRTKVDDGHEEYKLRIIKEATEQQAVLDTE